MGGLRAQHFSAKIVSLSAQENKRNQNRFVAASKKTILAFFDSPGLTVTIRFR